MGYYKGYIPKKLGLIYGIILFLVGLLYFTH